MLLCLGHARAGEIALTFDDAPLQGNGFMGGMEKTQRIIKGLQAQNVEDALFFVTTGNIRDEEGAKRLKAYANAGFHLASHSHKHVSANKVDTNDYLMDFYQSHLTLQDYDNVLKLHRFPYLHYGQTQEARTKIQSHLNDLGYGFGYVTVDNFDWHINGRLLAAHRQGKQIDLEKLKQLYLETIWESIVFYDQIASTHLKQPVKHVLLLHENELAALFIGDLVAYIRSKGWKIISPAEAYKDPVLNVYSPAFSFNKQGRVAALAHEKGVDTKLLRHESENAQFLDKKLQQQQVFKSD
ncbi:polysaccharide deacetylase family protein [Thalassomonas viridans]|uniref:Polysaccharide deacetylase family protein n=2 Tax=Thalassomonas viridans TaxID=137584 RepID=A0AAE9Z8M9_9GAMM|nr:polysaccharide deacetylase family protein [Thalassomonas viridans]